MVRSAGSVQLSASVPGPVTNADRLCGGPEGHSDPPVHGVNPHAGVGLVHSPIRPKLLHVHVVSHVAAAAERTLWKKRASEIATAAAEHCRRRDAARPRRGTRLLARLSSGPLLARHDPAGSPRACASLRAHAHASDGLQGGGGEHGSSAAEGRLAATDRGTAGNLAASKVRSAAGGSSSGPDGPADAMGVAADAT